MRLKNVFTTRVSFRGWLAAAALAVVQITAHSAVVTQCSTALPNVSTVSTGADPSSACAAAVNAFNAKFPTVPSSFVSATTTTCTYKASNGYNGTIPMSCTQVTNSCPSAGTTKKLNFTVGYTPDPDLKYEQLGDVNMANFGAVVKKGSACSYNGCTVNFSSSLDGLTDEWWESLKPNSQGLYRISVNMKTTYTGASCTPTAQETSVTSPNADPATCKGTYGTVSGKPVCIPSGLGNTNLVTSQSPSTTTIHAGNPTAGSSGGLTDIPPGGSGNADGGPSTTYDGTTFPVNGPLPSGSGTSTNPQPDPKTDCDKKPDSIGCSEYGTPDNGIQLNKLDSGVSSIQILSFASMQSCPADLTFTVMGNQYSISYAPVCNVAASYIAPIVLLISTAIAAFIFVGGFKN